MSWLHHLDNAAAIGGVQRISSYVFGDSAAAKPFEGWIKDQLREFGSADQLIAALGGELNEELIIQIRAAKVDPLW